MSPLFRERLDILTGGKLTATDLRTAMLLKCGMKPNQLEVLLGKSHGAIVSRRQVLCRKVFDDKQSVTLIDSIIRLL